MTKLRNRHKHKGFRFSVMKCGRQIGAVSGVHVLRVAVIVANSRQVMAENIEKVLLQVGLCVRRMRNRR